MYDTHFLEQQITYIKNQLDYLHIMIAQYAIGVDPAFGGRSETGIILAGKDIFNQIIILGDFSGNYKPDIWIYYVQKIAIDFNATIVIEVNHGGQLINSLFQNFSVYPQRATTCKYERAVPCYLLYKEKKIIHLQEFVQLEQQMLYFSTAKKDRVDALVWVIHYLQETNQISHCELI